MSHGEGQMQNKLILLLAAVLIVGCAKQREYERVYKSPELIQRSVVQDPGRDYLYLVSTLGSPRDVPTAQPFYQGEEKIVRMKFEKSGINIYQVDEDKRFEDNPLNDSPVLTIPGEYMEFRCKEDANGNCVQEEEENEDLEWNQKAFFKPEFEKLIVAENNYLNLSNLDSSCVKPVKDSTRVISYELEKGLFNLQLETTYKTNGSDYFCLWDYLQGGKLKNSTFKVQYQYSMIALEDIASADYEAVDYPVADHDDFGFFKNKRKDLTDDLDPNRPKIKYFLNRWNPNKKKLVYHLSDSFNKEKNLYLKDATYNAIGRMNSLFKNSGINLEIELKEPSGKSPGDLRNTMIVLIDEPLANGLLGYGPSVKNPRTGEIVQARTNMYSGVLRSGVRRSYQAMVDLSKKQANQKTDLGSKTALILEQAKSVQPLDMNSFVNKMNFKIDPARGANLNRLQKLALAAGQLKQQELALKEDPGLMKALAAKISKEKNRGEVAHIEAEKREMYKEQSASTFDTVMNLHSTNNGYHESMFNFEGLGKKILPEIQALGKGPFTNGILKNWEALTKDQQDEIAKIIMVHTYTATLVHEFGHNLGLRHNFAGSADKKNRYTEKEIKDLKLGFHDVPAYSSVMDYAYSDLNELSNYGKYDLAALKFAYNRTVDVLVTKDVGGKKEVEIKQEHLKTSLTTFKKQLELTNEEAAENKENVTLTLKPYDFCTDENAGLSANCNRFDEGSTYTEIANHHAENYFNKYKYRNWRDGREVFQDYGIKSHVYYTEYRFKRMRLIYETFETYSSIFGQGQMEQGCTPEMLAQFPVCETINDLKEAAKIAGNFFMTILKTPDFSCAVADPAKPNEIIDVKFMKDIYKNLRFELNYVPSSCFDPNVQAELLKNTEPDPETQQPVDAPRVAVAESGLFFNDIKDPDPRFPYSNDLAVRGIWSDKLLAVKYLTTRKSKSVTETVLSSMLDHTEIRQDFISFVQHLTMRTPLATPIKFQAEDGELLEIPYNIDSNYVIATQPVYTGGPYVSYSMMFKFDLPVNGTQDFSKKVLEQAVRYNDTEDKTYKANAKALVNAITTVRRTEGTVNVDPSKSALNLDSYTYIANDQNSLGKILIDSIRSLDVLQSIGEEVATKVLQVRTEFPTDINCR